MSEISKTLEESAFFGLLLSLAAYETGIFLKKNIFKNRNSIIQKHREIII